MPPSYPRVGQWFRHPNGALLEVVAVDESEDAIEIQMFDGTIDEFDIDSWREQFLVEVAAPDDWSGSFDMDPDDYRGRDSNEMPPGFHDPLEILDKES